MGYKILESILELVILESEVKDQLEFNLGELDRLSDLMKIERYRKLESIREVYNRKYEETLELLEELRTIEEIKDMLGINE